MKAYLNKADYRPTKNKFYKIVLFIFLNNSDFQNRRSSDIKHRVIQARTLILLSKEFKLTSTYFKNQFIC